MPFMPAPTRTIRLRVLGQSLAAALILVLSQTSSGLASAKESGSPVDKINAEAAASQVEVVPLRANVSVLLGSGGNIGVLATPGGAVLIDSGIGVSSGKIQSALTDLQASKVLYVVNTHWHWDHTDGNKWLIESGAQAAAHPNTIKYLSSRRHVADWSFTFEAVDSAARPSIPVETRRTFSVGDTSVIAEYYGPSHTDGDLLVHLPESDVIFTGDTWWNGHYPFIDTDAGGSIDGMIQAAERTLRRASDRTVIVPGHGPAGSKRDLQSYRDMLVDVRNRVASLKRAGRTLEEIIEAAPTRAYDEKWGTFVINPSFFVSLVYRGV